MPQGEARLCADLEKKPLIAVTAFQPRLPGKLIFGARLAQKLRTWALRSEDGSVGVSGALAACLRSPPPVLTPQRRAAQAR